MTTIATISKGSLQRIERTTRAGMGDTRGRAAGSNWARPAGDDGFLTSGVAASSSAFFAQLIANDNAGSQATIEANTGAITYLMARDHLADLPVGFLISRVA